MEGVDVWAIYNGLRPVEASLLNLWRANIDIQSSDGKAKGGGEHIGGAELSARDEPRDIGFGRGVTRAGSFLDDWHHRVVTTRGLAESATGGMCPTGPCCRLHIPWVRRDLHSRDEDAPRPQILPACRLGRPQGFSFQSNV